MQKKFYITSAIPYVNAAPHIGHALEFIQTDTIARFHKHIGEDILMLCGADENALKNVQAAEKAGLPIQEFIDKNAKLFQALAEKLDVHFDVFQKGSDQTHHFVSSQKLWQLCKKAGDIYKKSYKGLYCVGCEAFYTLDELNENGECFEHPGKKLEEVEEENYFFNLKKYGKKIKELLESGRLKVIPAKREHEVLSFLELGLNDISISRSNERANNWGVPVPGDDKQRMYVWFDALNIYQSGIGFGWDEKTYEKWWPAEVHVIGKGITRFHAVYWPAFLLSAGLDLPKKIFIHEYFTVNGQKMSKTLGNVIDPFELIKKYGAEPLRYYFLAKFSPFSDGDFSEEKFKKAYNADLANGLGNLISRVSAMAKGFTFPVAQKKEMSLNVSLALKLQYEFDHALDVVWDKIKQCDVAINQERIWDLKTHEKIKALSPLVIDIRQIAVDLSPFLPNTAEKILDQFKGPTIKSQPPLFPRIL